VSRFQSDHRHRGAFLAIGKRSFAWTKARAPHRPEDLRTGHLDESLHALHAVLDELKGESIRWIFGMEQMPQWLQSPAVGARHLEELRTATLVHAKSRLGTAPGADNEWLIDGQWHPGRPFLCRALTSKTLALLSARPKVTSALDTGLSLIDHRVDGQWYCLSMPREAHLVFFKSGQCSYLRSFRLAPDQTTEDMAGQLRKEWHRDTIRANLTSDTLKWMHLSACELPCLPGDLAWASEPLQRHLSDQIKHLSASEDAEDLLRMTLALQTWEKRR
jgi:hypothetical protein